MPERDLNELVRGDTWTMKITLTDDGTPIDITGDQFWVTLKLDPEVTDDEADATAEVTASGVDATNGIVFLSLAAAATVDLTVARYYYDIQRQVFGSGAVQTLLYGRVKVVRDITRRYGGG